MPRVLVFTDEPVLAAGFRAITADENDIQVALTTTEFPALLAALDEECTDVVLVDFGPEMGVGQVIELMRRAPDAKIILWLNGVPLSLAHQAREVGVRGILRKSASAELTLRCVRKVGEGESWFERDLLDSLLSYKRVKLSPRERQLLALVTQGMSNKQIASALLISEGTVKVYFSKLFRKVGVSDRFELALFGLQHMEWSSETATRKELGLTLQRIGTPREEPGARAAARDSRRR